MENFVCKSELLKNFFEQLSLFLPTYLHKLVAVSHNFSKTGQDANLHTTSFIKIEACEVLCFNFIWMKLGFVSNIILLMKSQPRNEISVFPIVLTVEQPLEQPPLVGNYNALQFFTWLT